MEKRRGCRHGDCQRRMARRRLRLPPSAVKRDAAGDAELPSARHQLTMGIAGVEPGGDRGAGPNGFQASDRRLGGQGFAFRNGPQDVQIVGGVNAARSLRGRQGVAAGQVPTAQDGWPLQADRKQRMGHHLGMVGAQVSRVEVVEPRGIGHDPPGIHLVAEGLRGLTYQRRIIGHGSILRLIEFKRRMQRPHCQFHVAFRND